MDKARARRAREEAAKWEREKPAADDALKARREREMELGANGAAATTNAAAAALPPGFNPYQANFASSTAARAAIALADGGAGAGAIPETEQDPGQVLPNEAGFRQHAEGSAQCRWLLLPRTC